MMLMIEIRRSTLGSSTLKAVYGIHCADADDSYLVTAYAAMEAASECLVPGKWIMEYLPILRHIPTWIPGATEQRLFKHSKELHGKIKKMAYDYVKANLVGYFYHQAGCAISS